LVVDSNPGLRRLFTVELEEAGYATLGAESAYDAKRFAADDPPAAIVLNATWAPEVAARLIRELRSNDRLRGVPIVGLAWVAGSEQRLLSAGADCCLRDVPTRGDVLKAVEWALSVYGDRPAA
jgi:DNA-binding response OmpR family regulator